LPSKEYSRKRDEIIFPVRKILLFGFYLIISVALMYEGWVVTDAEGDALRVTSLSVISVAKTDALVVIVVKSKSIFR
jgi:hypothetical protein